MLFAGQLRHGVAAVLLFVAPVVAAPMFEIIDLGPTTQGGWERMLLGAVNNAGQAIGG